MASVASDEGLCTSPRSGLGARCKGRVCETGGYGGYGGCGCGCGCGWCGAGAVAVEVRQSSEPGCCWRGGRVGSWADCQRAAHRPFIAASGESEWQVTRVMEARLSIIIDHQSTTSSRSHTPTHSTRPTRPPPIHRLSTAIHHLSCLSCLSYPSWLSGCLPTGLSSRPPAN